MLRKINIKEIDMQYTFIPDSVIALVYRLKINDFLLTAMTVSLMLKGLTEYPVYLQLIFVPLLLITSERVGNFSVPMPIKTIINIICMVTLSLLNPLSIKLTPPWL